MLKELLDLLVRPELQAPMALMVSMDSKALRGRLAPRGRLVPQVPQVLKGQQDLPVQLVRKAQLVQQARQA